MWCRLGQRRTGPRGRVMGSGAWLAWALSAATSVQLAPSPVYVALVVAIAALVVSMPRPDGSVRPRVPVLLAVGVVFALAADALDRSPPTDGRNVLLTTPQFALPDSWVASRSGEPSSPRSMLQSLAEGFVIVGDDGSVRRVQRESSHTTSSCSRRHARLRRTRARGHRRARLRAVDASAPSAPVRDADRARTGGPVVRRGRFLRRSCPILERGMERAVALAESMDSRLRLRRRHRRRTAERMVRPRLSCSHWRGAFVALVGQARTAAIGLGLVGVAGLIAAVAACVDTNVAAPGTGPAASPEPTGRGDAALSRRANARRLLGSIGRGLACVVRQPVALADVPRRARPEIGLLLVPLACRPASTGAPPSPSPLTEPVREHV